MTVEPTSPIAAGAAGSPCAQSALAPNTERAGPHPARKSADDERAACVSAAGRSIMEPGDGGGRQPWIVPAPDDRTQAGQADEPDARSEIGNRVDLVG